MNRVGMHRPRLEDVLTDRPRILFVGINPSLRSGEVGHHFASPGNPFWRLLFAAGLIPVPLRAEQDRQLAELGDALVNLCKRPTRSASALRPDELEAGVRELKRVIARLRPRVVAFLGLSLYRQFFHLKQSGGAGAKAETIHGARVFVLPNPSGLNASFPGFEHKLVWFRRLKEFAEAGGP